MMSGADRPNTPQPVILNCDTANEVDDQFAIAYALGSRALKVRGVVSVHNTIAHGPGSRDRYQAEAERVVRLCGHDTPCIPGADSPMGHPDRPVASAGLEFMREAARVEPLIVLATGPLTDIASLLISAPEVAADLCILWLGGFLNAADYRRYQKDELNGRADIVAWRRIWQSDAQLLHVPGWPGPAKLVVASAAYAERLRALDRPIADYLADILSSWTQNRGIDKKILWDMATVAALTCPAAVTVAPRPAPCIDGAGAHDWQRPARVLSTLTDLRPDQVWTDFETALCRHPSVITEASP